MVTIKDASATGGPQHPAKVSSTAGPTCSSYTPAEGPHGAMMAPQTLPLQRQAAPMARKQPLTSLDEFDQELQQPSLQQALHGEYRLHEGHKGHVNDSSKLTEWTKR